MADAYLTSVDIVFYPEIINHRLRFGAPRYVRRLDRRRAMAGFVPDQVFGYIRWRAGDYGTQDWRLFICRSGRPHDQLQKIPGIRPGAECLLAVSGKARVKKILALIDSLEAENVLPQQIPTFYWRIVSNDIQVGKTPRKFSREKLSVS